MTKDIGGVDPLDDYVPATTYAVKTSGPFWKLDDGSGRHLHLLTPQELEEVPRGAIITSIMGENASVGTDLIDRDTRYGLTAWGFICPLDHEPED